jgi:site-specific recombinase XerD
VTKYISSLLDSENPKVFQYRLGQPLGNRGVEKILDGYFAQAEISGASVQSLRYTFATQHNAKGTHLKTVQEILGLADVRDVEINQMLTAELKSQELEAHAL